MGAGTGAPRLTGPKQCLGGLTWKAVAGEFSYNPGDICPSAGKKY